MVTESERMDQDSSSGEVAPSDPLMNNQCQQKDTEVTKRKTDTDEYIIPDGGWGWLVTFCCFIVYVILDGSAFSFGVIYAELLNYFNAAGGKTALIGALLYGFPLIIAPFVCAFVIHGGFRLVGVIGTIMTSIAFLLCTLAQSIDFLAIVLGLLGSAGMEMGYISAVLCLTYYFDKNRGLATGLAMSGSGVGTMIFPPLIEFLLNTYSWRGTCLVVGGICLNLLPCSLVFRPLKKKPKAEDKHEQFERMVSEINGNKYLLQRRMSKSMIDLPTSSSSKDEGNKLHNSDPYLSSNNPKHHFKYPNKFTNSFHHGGYALAFSLTSIEESETQTDQKCVFKVVKAFRTLGHHTMKILRSSVDWSLFRNLGFMIFGFSNFLLCVYFILPYLYIPHMAQISGIDEQRASFLVSIMGITSTVSQIALGWIGDKTKASIHIYMICMFLAGGSLLLMSFYPANYGLFCALCVIFGIGISGNYALTTLILIDLVGLEKLAVAFGLFQLQQGIASLFGTPIGGWIYDFTGSYFWAFISGGICIFASGLVLIPIPFLRKCKRNCTDSNTEAPIVEGPSGIEMRETETLEV